VLNFNEQIINKFKNHKNIAFIFNKCDLLSKTINLQHLQNNLKDLVAKYHKASNNIFTVSSINHFGLAKLNEFISRKIKLNQKIYFIGITNSGKSSLINELLKINNSYIKPLTTSPLTNTTIDYKKIKINKHDVIDTPGYESSSSICQLVDFNQEKDFNTIKPIKPISFQLVDNQSIFIDSFLRLDFHILNKGSVILLTNNNKLKIHRTATKNIENINNKNDFFHYYVDKNQKKITNKIVLDSNKKYNLIIDGLGIIKISKVNEVTLSIYPSIRHLIIENGVI